MAKLALVYGMRLLPEEDLGELKDATVVLKNGKTARVTNMSALIALARAMGRARTCSQNAHHRVARTPPSSAARPVKPPS